MPLLAAFIRVLVVWLVQNVFQGLTTWFTQLTIARLAYVAVVVGLILTFFTAVHALISGLNAALPSWIGVAVTWVIPSNVPYVITYYFAVRSAGTVFRFSRSIIWGAAGGGQTGMGSLGN